MQSSFDPVLALLQGWVEATAEFLKSIDPHHLVTLDCEGFLGSLTPGRVLSAYHL